ncbi:MAG TPA: hypothetical protein VGM82_17520 [Gemmatimonadaceae bacterium]|jgi:hypothetical protein
MLVTNGPQWFDRRRPEHNWPSIVVSIGITLALFASAFLAMQTVGRLRDDRSQAIEPPVVVHLTPPPPPIQRPRPAAVTPPQAAPPTTVPTQIATPPAAVTPPIDASRIAPTARTDTAAGRTTPPALDLPAIPKGVLPAPVTGADIPAGAPDGSNNPAGVTIGSRTANTAAYRDSMLTAKLKGLPFLATTHAPTGENLQALRGSQANAAKVARRSTTAGNADVHVMQGEGIDGVGAVGGGAGVPGNALGLGRSLGLPFLSKGPSAAQRRKNEAIEADYRAGLGRLQDRILLKRDSLLADSLRRDSLAKRRP